MASQAGTTNYCFLGLSGNFNVQLRYTTISTVQYYDFQQPQDIMSRCQAIFAFIVSVLLNFLQLKYQGKVESPFETHPNTTLLAVTSLVLYCISMSYDAKLRISENHPYIHCLVVSSMAIFGPQSLASLLSILFPESLCLLIFSVSILLSLYQLISHQSQLKRIWEWLKDIIKDKFCHQSSRRRGLVSIQLPWLPDQDIGGEVSRKHGSKVARRSKDAGKLSKTIASTNYGVVGSVKDGNAAS